MLFPIMVSHFLLPDIPPVYPGQSEDDTMTRAYFKHHCAWVASQDFHDQMASFVHATPFDMRRVQLRHEKRMRWIARMCGFDAVSCFERMSLKLLQRDEEMRAMTV